MDIKGILNWLVNLHVVPSGWLTKGTGWLSIISALACLLGHPLPIWPCPQDPAVELSVGLAALGLGRRS